jgi:hypothetical protein
VPQCEQNGRRAIGELSYQSGSLSQFTAATGNWMKLAAKPPVARWHIRQ